MDKDFFFTIKEAVTAEYKDRGSKFIAFVYPIQSVDEFRIHLNALKKEHPKAVHYCFAYRLGIDGNNFRVSDDGEPSGTAGRPILGQIDSKELTNILIVVVRYFGGALLGVPGLINAYKTSSAQAMQNAVIISKPITKNMKLQFDYAQINDLMHLFRKYECEIVQREMGLYCVFDLDVPVKKYEDLVSLLKTYKEVEIV